MTFNQFQDDTIGKSWLGTNKSDKGQCLGYVSYGLQQMYGLLYPIVGAESAYQMLTAQNNHPEFLQQIQGTQGMDVGDIWVMDRAAGLPDGHIGFVTALGDGGFYTIEQNWTPNKVTSRFRQFNEIKGYIKVGGRMKYTDAELDQQFDGLGEYIRGIWSVNSNQNDAIAQLTKALAENSQIDATQAAQILKAVSDSQTAIKTSQEALNKPTGATKTLSELIVDFFNKFKG